MSKELRQDLRKLRKKDKALRLAVDKKIEEIVSRDSKTIEYYKNLRAPLNEFKRVHVGNFVLVFKVDKANSFVFFEYIKHHDEAYKK